MLKFSLNISLTLQEGALPERFGKAVALGFDAVEIQFPYGYSPEVLAQRAKGAGCRVVLINFPAGDLTAGELGIAALPGRAAEFRTGIEKGLAYADALGAPALNVLAGKLPPGCNRAEALDCLAENLALACAAAPDRCIFLEAANGRDQPGFVIQTGAQALETLDRVGAPNLFLQYDFYHAARMGEDIPAFLRANLARIGHIQFADCPGRGEPGSGTTDFPALFALLEELGYRGWCGAEYRPTGKIRESLAWRDIYSRQGTAQ
jgi:hydroxypyruvate isomerase